MRCFDKKQPLDDILSRSLDGGVMFDLPQRDRALARAIVATSLRRKGQLDHVLAHFSSAACRTKAGTLYPILLSGAAQLIFLKTPPHAAIDLAVRLAQYDPRARRYDKLVNAVLRRVAEEGEAIAAGLDAPRVNTPDWLWAALGRSVGARSARAPSPTTHLIEPPLDLTVKSDPEALGGAASRPRAADAERAPPAQGPHRSAPRLCGRRMVGAGRRRLAAGASARRCRGQARRRSLRRAWRQDGAACPSRRLGRRRRHFEDAAQAARRQSRRLGLEAETVLADAATWLPDERFDAILLDAPCSSTGTIRRHPDIPYTKSPKDIEALSALQARLLDNAARLLKPGGRLVYSTCSLELEEGEAQVAALLARNEALRLDPIAPASLLGEADWIWPSGLLQDLPLPAQARQRRNGAAWTVFSPQGSSAPVERGIGTQCQSICRPEHCLGHICRRPRPAGQAPKLGEQAKNGG